MPYSKLQEDTTVDDFTIGTSFRISLNEATINKDSRTADIVAITEGWSYNGRYYSKPVAESLSSHLLERKKIYLNHVEEKQKTLGRDLRDWVATVEESYGKEGKTYAKISFVENDAGNFIFKEALKHPDQIQFSIDAIARAREGEAVGRKGTIIEKFVFLDSLDVVDYASAGGKLITAYASKNMTDLDTLKEVADSLKDAVSKKVVRAELEILMGTFINLLYGISWSYEEEEEISKKEQINKLVKEFLEEFNGLDLVKAFESYKNKEGEELMEVTLESLKKDFPEVLEQYKSEIEATDSLTEKDEEITSLTSKISNLETEVSTLTEKSDTLQTDLDDKDSKLTEAEEKLNKYKFAEELSKKTTKVKELVKNSKLGDFDKLPEYIKQDLLNKEEDKVSEAITALESFIVNPPVSVVEGAGETTSADEDTTDPIKSLPDDAVVEMIKRNRR